MTEVLLLLLAIALMVLCGVFVAAEFSLTTVERAELERAAAAGERGAAGALAAVRRLTFQLSGAQLGITLTSLIIGMLAEPSIASLLNGPLEAAGLPSATASAVAVLLGVVLSTVALMVIGELVPKNWAISRPLAVAKAVAGPQRAFSAVAGPLIGGLNTTANWFVRRIGLEPTEELNSVRTPQELGALARHSAKAGTLEPGTAELFVRTLRLSERTASSVMVPRIRVHTLREGDTAAELVALAARTGHSRFPVHPGDLDDVSGVVHLKDALALPEEERDVRTVGSLASEPVRVPETVPLDELLEQLRWRQTIAVVVDEYGGTAGVVTLEDVIEEIVGEVRDEHDTDEQPGVVALPDPDGTGPRWQVTGVHQADDLYEAIGLRLPEGPYETVAGYLADRLERIPVVGDTVDLAGWTLTVRSVDHHHAASVLVVRTGDQDATAAPEDEGADR
ncbi:hemolysin family protein [Allostreptomyces psammosilenae]|uniref:CBS domain containing-hemolysin-like protein n=1 Tax=Allostreptomyces psammosilenae TaxID=1892865 RepID=A0A853A8X9_9ACTN|nr:hemolysin family protein [Allostreptomyces psammosilenae]NYI06978.1 CBS domain containing-hemolysin-like protein [Allostreptomyces psammosilenae]